jgi:hypothetical protein
MRESNSPTLRTKERRSLTIRRNGELGFEPSLRASKAPVLPLHVLPKPPQRIELCRSPYKGPHVSPELRAKADAENRTRVSPVPGEGVAISTTSARVRPLRIELSPHRVRAGYAAVNTWDAKSSRRDSNPQPPPWQGGAQPIELLLLGAASRSLTCISP